ncbi:MAG: NAD(P)-binding domain-containing protein [Armatimonadetes bacterium]|nr:NAD(P)-binding domain-containing protein [Armatimonadota bacterium]
MAELDARPFPPGRYPLVVVGSGPGGLQVSYLLRRLGVEHAVISEDAGPGGMFRRYPLFQRLNTWSKPYAIAERRTRPYEWYDWNSLLGDEPEHRSLVPEFMDGVSYFPSRAEMAAGLQAFAERASIQVQYQCRWEAMRREDDGFVLVTSDGEYRSRVVVVAVGMAEPWKPPIPGLEDAPHYVETRPAREYAGKRVFLVGKRNSGFEVADALLPWARQIILGSPRPPLISVLSAGAGVRAKYLVPYEDHIMGGGVFILDASIDRVERAAGGWKVVTSGERTGHIEFVMDQVIAATGFGTPLRDLPSIGVATFSQGRLPRQTAWWESATVPGIYFAGAITQGAIGLRKHGSAGNSAGVAGFRHNARVLAIHLARTHFGVQIPRPPLRREEIVPYLLSEATRAPELWNQQGYLARLVMFDPAAGCVDDGIVPLAAFVDAEGPDAVAMAVETDASGEHHPTVYIRREGRVGEHALPANPLNTYEGTRYQTELTALLAGLI